MSVQEQVPAPPSEDGGQRHRILDRFHRLGQPIINVGMAAGAAVVEGVVGIAHDVRGGWQSVVDPENHPPVSGPDAPFERALQWLASKGPSRAEYVDLEPSAWNGPEGGVPHAHIDRVLAAAIKHGGDIPDSVRMTPADRGVVTGALAVLGFPSAAARYGSSTDARRAAGLNGPQSGTSKKNRIWLPNEVSVAVSLGQGTTIAGLVVAAEIFEHKHPKTVVRRGVTLVQQTVGYDPGEAEPVRNRGEDMLLRMANALLAEVYGAGGQERNVPGSVAPLLLARAVECAGATKLDPVATANLVEYYEATWQANEVHHASYPKELAELHKKILLTRVHVHREGQDRAIMLAKQHGIPLTARFVASMVEQYRRDLETTYLAEVAVEYAAERKAVLQEQRLKARQRHEAARQEQERQALLKQSMLEARKHYASTVLSNAAVVRDLGLRGLRQRRPEMVARAYAALCEQQYVGAPDAVPAFSALAMAIAGTPKGFDVVIDHLYARRNVIAEGFGAPEELVLVRTLQLRHVSPASRTKLTALRKAVQGAAFSQKIIESNTGDEEGVRPATEETVHASLYGENARQMMSIVKAGQSIDRAMRSIEWRELTPSQLELLSCLTISRRLQAIRAAEDIALTKQEKRGLAYELDVLQSWRKDIRGASFTVSGQYQPAETYPGVPPRAGSAPSFAEYTQNVFDRLRAYFPNGDNDLLSWFRWFDRHYQDAPVDVAVAVLYGVEDRMLYLFETIDEIRPADVLELVFGYGDVDMRDLAEVYRKMQTENPDLTARQLRTHIVEGLRRRAERSER